MALPTGRPQLSDETPGPALALLCICSAAASAVVAGSTIGYQVRQRQLDRVSHLDAKWNILLTAGLVRFLAETKSARDMLMMADCEHYSVCRHIQTGRLWFGLPDRHIVCS